MKHNTHLPLLMALLWAGVAGSGRADNSQIRPRLSVAPARLTPMMTANPNDPAWADASTIDGLPLSLESPGKGAEAVPTQVKVIWDASYLYIRFVCAASEVYSPYKAHDDPLYKGDCVEVFLDAKGDARQWVELEVSPRNATFDQVMTLTADPQSDSDLILTKALRDRDLWRDPAWTLDGLRTASSVRKSGRKVAGWTVDVALPAATVLRRLGLDRFAPMTLRANFLRYEYPAAHGGERALIAMNWSPVRWGCPHISPQAMGYLDLVSDP